MAKLEVKAGTTSKITKVFLQDSSSTTGAGLTGLTNASSGLVAYYIKEGDASATVISLASGTVGTWSSGGFKEVDSANMPGVYELGLPNTAVASGKSTVVMLKGATNLVPCVLEIELTAVDNQDGVRFGLTGLANATPGAAGGLFIAGSNAATTANITGNITGNLSGSVGSVTGAVGSVTSGVTVTTNNDKTGYTASTVSDKTGYALTSGEHTNIAADVLDAAAASHNTAGTIGNKINSAGGAADPWGTAIPGAYASGTAGNIIGNNLDAKVSAVKAKTDNLPASPAAIGSAMTLDFTQSVPTSNTAQTVGDALNAARAQGFGKWKIDSTAKTLTLYASDNSTAIWTFALDSVTSPTTRTGSKP